MGAKWCQQNRLSKSQSLVKYGPAASCRKIRETVHLPTISEETQKTVDANHLSFAQWGRTPGPLSTSEREGRMKSNRYMHLYLSL